MDAQEREIRRWHSLAVLLGLLLGGIALIWIGAQVSDKSPTLAGVLRDIGFQFGTVAVLAVVYESYVKGRESTNTIKQISKGVVAEIRRQLNAGQSAREVTAIYPDRQSVDYAQLIGGAEERIDIMTTNLTSLEMYHSLLVERSRRGVRVRLLTLHPGHEFVIRRHGELGFKKPEHFFDEMMASLRHLCVEAERLAQTNPGASLEVKVYANPPTMMLFRSDCRLVLGLITNARRSREEPHIEFLLDDGVTGCATALAEHFEKNWADGRSVDSSDLDDFTLSSYVLEV